MLNKSKSTLQAQKKVFRLLILGIAVISIIAAILMMDRTPYRKPAESKVDLPSDKVTPQDLWMAKIENDNTLMDQRMKTLESLIVHEKQLNETKVNENIELRQEIMRLKSEMKNSADKKNRESEPIQGGNGTSDPFITMQQKGPVMPLRPVLKELVMRKAGRELSNVNQTIPAGTTVKALLVSSVDAPCGVYSSSDPQPVKLRIIDDGHLPKDVMAKLKGGLVIASAYGDISTERVYIRLERLTKVEESGEFVETSVTGFITGEDGKFGIRGTVVDKSGKMVENAAVSGFFSGVGQFLNTSMLSSLNNKCCDTTPVGWELLQAGGLEGSTTAFDMLAEYYINRAEQIMPVIEVSAGRIVDITFTHKAELGDIHTQEKVKEIRNQNKRGDNA